MKKFLQKFLITEVLLFRKLKVKSKSIFPKGVKILKNFRKKKFEKNLAAFLFVRRHTWWNPLQVTPSGVILPPNRGHITIKIYTPGPAGDDFSKIKMFQKSKKGQSGKARWRGDIQISAAFAKNSFNIDKILFGLLWVVLGQLWSLFLKIFKGWKTLHKLCIFHPFFWFRF